MDIKEEVRRRIADLTRFAYERGYRDGAQSALAEIEGMASGDVVEQLAIDKPSLEGAVAKKAIGRKPRKAVRKPGGKARPKRSKNDKAAGKPKTLVVQEILQSLLAANGQARRDEVLQAAQAENPAITKFDLGNGLRASIKRSEVRVSPNDNSILIRA